LGVLATAIILAACSATAVAPNATRGDTRAEQDRLVLTIATGETHPEEAAAFAGAVADISQGSIEVIVDNESVRVGPTYETDVIRHVADGEAQLGFVAARAFDTVGVQSFVGLHAPFLIDSYELEEQVLRSDWGQALLEGTRPAGVVGIDYFQGPFRRPLGYTRALLVPDDYDGARIGIRASKLTEMTMEALGATPVVFHPGDTTGLDGMEVHMGQIIGARYADGADSLTGNVIFWPRPGVIFANATTFDALSADQRSVLREAGRKMFDDSVASVLANGANAPDVLCARGLQMKSAPDGAVGALRAAVQPVYDELDKDAGTKATIDAIEALRASTDADPDAVECAVAAATPEPPAAVVDSPIVGTWTTSFTKEELADSPLLYDAGEVNNENWGDFSMTFQADGRVSFAQENASASYSTSGTYTVSGDHVELTFSQGGNAGETFGARWSLFRDTLTFERVEGEDLPTPYLVRSWTRVP
jgi:TRAP-type C4-dicarboxylate transport system substrate-binding protein